MIGSVRASKDFFEVGAEAAPKQIEERGYEAAMRSRGRGVGFC